MGERYALLVASIGGFAPCREVLRLTRATSTTMAMPTTTPRRTRGFAPCPDSAERPDRVGTCPKAEPVEEGRRDVRAWARESAPREGWRTLLAWRRASAFSAVSCGYRTLRCNPCGVPFEIRGTKAGAPRAARGKARGEAPRALGILHDGKRRRPEQPLPRRR